MNLPNFTSKSHLDKRLRIFFLKYVKTLSFHFMEGYKMEESQENLINKVFQLDVKSMKQKFLKVSLNEKFFQKKKKNELLFSLMKLD